MFAGSIYSVSLTDGLSFPLNYHLIFIIFAIIILIVMVMVACLPKTITKQKRQHSPAEDVEPIKDRASDRTESTDHSESTV